MEGGSGERERERERVDRSDDDHPSSTGDAGTDKQATWLSGHFITRLLSATVQETSHAGENKFGFMTKARVRRCAWGEEQKGKSVEMCVGGGAER